MATATHDLEHALARRKEIDLSVMPVTDVVQSFRSKYGAGEIKNSS